MLQYHGSTHWGQPLLHKELGTVRGAHLCAVTCCTTHIPESLAGWEGYDAEGQEVPSCNGPLLLGVVGNLANQLAEDLVSQFRALNTVGDGGLNGEVSLIWLEVSFQQFAQILEDATSQVHIVWVMHVHHGGREVAILCKEKHFCLWNRVL